MEVLYKNYTANVIVARLFKYFLRECPVPINIEFVPYKAYNHKIPWFQNVQCLYNIYFLIYNLII